MANNCKVIAPGKSVSSWQQFGLKLVSFYRGRDVVIAIDLTESVGLNEEGRLRLTQIIEDSLRSGDTVYLVPFASVVNPLNPDLKSLTRQQGIKFKGKPENVDQILSVLPFESNISLRNTDIQRAELFIYKGLAQLNQCRLRDNIALKHQSIVWITDAPLLTKPGIDSDTWIETPAKSQFRLANSSGSKARQSWLQALPIQKREKTITTEENSTYQLSIVDIKPTVQEFCTPVPGGKETCLVNPYLVKRLSLPILIALVLLTLGGFWTRYLLSLRQKWKVKVTFESDDNQDPQTCFLKNKQKIAIGDNSLDAITCPDEELRGYLLRQGNKLYLKPTKIAPIFYRDRQISQETEMTRDRFTLNCPVDDQDFEISIKISK